MNPATPPRVTIITATYHRPDTLRLALESALAQQFADFEHWVIGDGCTDETGAVVASFGDPRLQYYNRPTNSGSQGVPNNDGFARSRGHYIAYLGHDDLWLPWHLAELVEALDSSGADLAHGLTVRIGPGGVASCGGAAVEAGEQPTCPPSSWLLRREVLAAIGGWREVEAVPRTIDHDVLYRLHEAGYRFAACRRLTVIKFPSSLYPRAYQLGDDAQAAYAAALRHDPDGLESRLLHDIAVAFARHRCPQLGWSGLLRRAAALAYLSCERLYGADRWPLPALRLSYWRYTRRRKRVQRGLAPKPGQGHR